MRTVKRLLEIAEKDNIAEDLDQDRLDEIGQFCLAGYETDIATCTDHFEQLEENQKIAAQEIEAKNFPWEGAANVKFPILTVAAIQFNARAYPQLVPASGVARATFYGEDRDNIKADRTERISKHMSYQIREKMTGWEEETDSLLLQLPVIGNIFRKTWHDPKYKGPRSSKLMPQQFIVNNDENTILEDCPRTTEIFKRYPYQIKNNINNGLWLDIDIDYGEEEKQELITLYEQHVWLNLYEDSEDVEPYIVTMTEEGKILRIKACFDDSTIFVNLDGEIRSIEDINYEIDSKNLDIRAKNLEALQIGQQNQLPPEEVVQIPPIKKPDIDKEKPLRLDKIQYYSDYFFFPSFKNKFYKDGLATLIASLSGTIDTNINQMLDAGTLQNMNSGLIAKTGKAIQKRSGFVPGEYQTIDTGGRPIRDMVMDFDFKGPSTGLFSLLGVLIDAAKDITSVKDIMVGDAPAGETATTSMIKQEEGMKMFSAIYLRLYKAMTSELKKIYRLNRKYLTSDEYFRWGDSDTYVSRTDYEDSTLDVQPTANPKESNTTQKILKAQVLMEMRMDPDADPKAITKNYLEAVGLSDEEYQKYFPGRQGPPPPNPDEIKTMSEAEKNKTQSAKNIADAEKIASETALTQAKIIDTLASAEAREAGTQINAYKVEAEALLNATRGNLTGGDPGVEKTPGDTGSIPAPLQPMEAGEAGTIMPVDQGLQQL